MPMLEGMYRLALLFVVGCVTQPTPVPVAAIGLVPGATLTASWSKTGEHSTYGTTTDGTVECTTTISHPCSFITYTRELVVSDDAASILWTDASNGSDLNGRTAATELPWIDPLELDDAGAIVLHQRGDDGGLRHDAHLAPDGAGGYSGDVTWSLFNVPAYTTFSVTIAQR